MPVDSEARLHAQMLIFNKSHMESMPSRCARLRAVLDEYCAR
jgi:hypothetical protein